MKTTEKFTNGMSIIMLEERFEMCLTVGRGRNEDCPHDGSFEQYM